MAAQHYARVPSGRISLPPPPQERTRRDFPLLASAAPVVGALAMWAMTQSPFSLLFAFLGPVIAIASIIDDRRLERRGATAERARFHRGVEAALAAIAAGHAREREQLARLALRPDELLRSAVRDPEWWRDTWENPVLVCLGLGTTVSTLELDPAPGLPSADDAGETGEAYERLRAAAAMVTDAPVLVDARQGIGIVGTPVLASAVARSVVAQLAFRLSPAQVAVSLDAGGRFHWAARLPHPRQADGGADRIQFRVIGAEPARPSPVVCAVAEHATGLPRDCRIVIRLDGAGKAVVDRNPSEARIERLLPWFVSEPQGRALAALATACATADGLVGGGDAIPGSLAFAGLPPAEPVRGRLPATFASGRGGAVTLDLVEDGPHAVIGGTTGSGKSELLISWVLALATTCSPAEVNFLLVDFKGGSSFAAVSRLPHTAGLITDLDQAAASRALESLRAELRHRERMTARAGVRSLDELEGDERVPRLVIVVDEFAVLANEFPELQLLFADLAARGRSLGVHLILCTQRPAGVIRDSVLANCSIRLSLRVNNGADSVAVIGTPAAAGLPPKASGRCYLSVGGADPFAVQAALATAADAEGVLARWAGVEYQVRRPWCEPLPEVVLPRELGASDLPGFAFALSDVPEEQSQPAALYHPEGDGNLVVFGGHNSGKTGVLAALEAAIGSADARCRALRIPGDVEGAWDAIAAAVARLAEPPGRSTLYLLDDVDALLGRFPEDYRFAFTEGVARLLREGPSRGCRVVLTAARVSSGIQPLVTLCDSRLLLRMADRQEHLLAGGDGGNYAAELPPGGGFWRGHRVQVALSPPGEVPPPSRADPPIPLGKGCALVVADAHAVAERIRAWHRRHGGALPEVIELSPHSGADGLRVRAGDQGDILIGGPMDWQSQWGSFASARASGPVVFAGCSVSEFRSLTGLRALPPPIGPAPGGAWMLIADGPVIRVQLPKWLTS